MKTVALDAMGSEASPRVDVAGACAAVREAELKVILVGDRAQIDRELQRHEVAHQDRIEVIHASEAISMSDSPSWAVKRKKDSSMLVATRLVTEGRADAVVSAGNSGAMMAAALFVLRRIRGIDRPALLTMLPTITGEVAVLDIGANVDCRALHLVQYALMGSVLLACRVAYTVPR